MANFNNNISNGGAVDADLAQVRAMAQSLIGNNDSYNFGDDKTDNEEIKLRDFSLSEDELLLFKGTHQGDFFSISDLIQISELQNGVLSIFSSVFADVFNVKLIYDNQRGWVFITSFRFMTEEQFKSAQDDSADKLSRAISSSVSPEEVNTNSVAQTLMLIIQKQQISSSDASKYAKFTKAAKEIFTSLLYCSNNNKKKKWVLGENYLLDTQTGSSYNGRTYTNIVGTVYLDAEKVLSVIGSTNDEKNNWDFKIDPVTTNIIGTDALVKIEKINKRKKKNLSNKYGIQFSR